MKEVSELQRAGERVPKLGRRAVVDSAPYGAEMYRWNSQVKGGGGSEGVDWSGDLQEIKQVWNGKVMNGFEAQK